MDYESADEAWEYFSEFYFEGSEGAEGFKDDNPLVGSSNYQVYMNDITRQAELVEYVSGLDGVREVNQSKEAAETLASLSHTGILYFDGYYCSSSSDFFSLSAILFLLVFLFVRKRSEL